MLLASGPSKTKETTPVQEFVTPPSEESQQKVVTPADSGKPAAARVKTEAKFAKQEPMTPETTAGKSAAATAASQVISSYDDVIILVGINNFCYLLRASKISFMRSY